MPRIGGEDGLGENSQIIPVISSFPYSAVFISLQRPVNMEHGNLVIIDENELRLINIFNIQCPISTKCLFRLLFINR